MDVPTQNSDCLCCRELLHAYSFKRCCFFILAFLLFTVAVMGVATFIIIFILKPQKPLFSLQTIRLNSYMLNAFSGSTLFVSSIVSLTLNAQNLNKVGIRYSPSRLHVLYKGLPIGVIRVPRFYQAAHSKNVSVQTRVFFHCVNISQIIAGFSLQDETRKNILQMRVLGDISAHVQILRITLPKVKVALDCDINVDYRELTFKNAVYTMRVVQNHTASFPMNSQTFSTKCSLAFYL